MDLLSILLNIKIDKYYCICKEDRIMENAEYLRKMTNGDILFITRPDRLDGYIACIQDSITNNYENIYIFEDKTVLLFENIERHLNAKHTNIPKDFDIFFLNYNIRDAYQYDLNLFDIREINNTTNQILNKRIFKDIIDNRHLTYEEILTIISMKNKKSFGIYPELSLIENNNSQFKNKYYKDFEVYCYQSENWSRFSEIGNILFKKINKMSGILPDISLGLVLHDNVTLYDNFVKELNEILLDMDKFDWDVIILSDELKTKETAKYLKINKEFFSSYQCYFIKNNKMENIYKFNRNIIKSNIAKNDYELKLIDGKYTDGNIEIKMDVNNRLYSSKDYISASGVILNSEIEYVVCFAGYNYSLYILNILKRLNKPLIIFLDADVDYFTDNVFFIKQEKILSIYSKLKVSELYISDLSLIYEMPLDRKFKYIYFYNYTPSLPFDIKVALKNSMHMIEETITPKTLKYVPEIQLKTQKKKQVVCIDKYNFNKAIDFYSKLPGNYKIIFYSYKINNNDNSNIIIKEYNINTIINDIIESEYMIYESNDKNTFICLEEAKSNNTKII